MPTRCLLGNILATNCENYDPIQLCRCLTGNTPLKSIAWVASKPPRPSSLIAELFARLPNGYGLPVPHLHLSH
jgi:hypothetical protein